MRMLGTNGLSGFFFWIKQAAAAAAAKINGIVETVVRVGTCPP